MAINKVEANGETLIDLTNDTAEAEDVLEGRTFHLRSGAPATGTYRPSAEIEARMRATVGHSSKNLLDLDKHNAYPSGMAVSELDADTGSIVATATGSLRGINYLNTSLGLEPNDGASYIVSFNNNEENTNGRLTIRSRGDNRVRHQVSLNTVGKKKLEFTADPELFPSGWYISLLVTGSTSETASIDVSGLMLREASISDDTFEPFVTPTDERIIALEARVAALEAIINNS